MSKRTLYSVFLAIALLCAQQGAAWHALSHIGESSRHSQSDSKLPHGEQCTKCAAFSQLGAACTSLAAPIDQAVFGATPPEHAAARFYRLSLRSYQSRAPPHRV